MEYEIYYRAQGMDEYSNIEHIRENRFEIIQIMAGDGIVLAGASVYPMLSGALYFIDMSKPHCTCPSGAGKYIRNKLILETEVFELFLKSAFAYEIVEAAVNSGGMCVPLEADAAECANAFFENMDKNRDNKSEFMLELHKLILLTGRSIGGDNPQDTGIIGKAVGYIDQNLSENIRVSELAQILHISKYYLCHLFRQRTGCTISEYILLKRLTEAKRLLRESEKRISDIAIELGFSSFSYFCAVFKRKYGMTPKEFKKN